MRAPHRRAFTLLELLIVVAIIAVLMGLLIPSFNRAREDAKKIMCLSTARTLAMACQMYLNDNERILPYSTWAGSFPNAKVGWLYEQPLQKKQEHVKTGAFWKYLEKYDAYRCPTHVKAESAAYGSSTSDALTSYLMNGAVNGYGSTTTGGNLVHYRITDFAPDDVLFWEADERNGAGWNDGSSYPWETFNPKEPGAAGLTVRHGRVAMIACFDGRAEWVSHEDFYRMASEGTRNRLWCKPSSSNGR